MRLCPATLDDIPALKVLIAESVRGLQTGDYTPSQIEGAIGTVYGTDRQMIADGTFFVVEDGDSIIAGGGGGRTLRSGLSTESYGPAGHQR